MATLEASRRPSMSSDVPRRLIGIQSVALTFFIANRTLAGWTRMKFRLFRPAADLVYGIKRQKKSADQKVTAVF